MSSASAAIIPTPLLMPEMLVGKIEPYILEDKKTRFEISPNFQFHFVYWINSIKNESLIDAGTIEKAQECANFLIKHTATELVLPFTAKGRETLYLPTSFKGEYTFEFSKIEQLQIFTLHCKVLKILENSGFTLHDSNSVSDGELAITYVCETTDKQELEKKFHAVDAKIHRIYYQKSE